MKIRYQSIFGSPITLMALALTMVAAKVQAAITLDYGYQTARGYNYANSYNVVAANAVNSGTTAANTGQGQSGSINSTFVSGPNGATFSSSAINVAASGYGFGDVYAYVNFTIDSTLSYSISGNLSGNVASGGAAQPYAFAGLSDFFTGSKYYEYEVQYPAPAGDYSYTLGDGIVSTSGSQFGSASGTLTPGTYQMLFQLQTYVQSGGAATGAGEFTFTLGDGAAAISAVPEPSTYIAGALLLLPFGASTLRIVRNRKQAA